MLKKNQEQSQLEVKSAGRLVLLPGIYLYCVHGTIQYTQYKLQVSSFWQSLSCLSKKISEKKKSDVRVL